MLTHETDPDTSAKCVVLNIYDDDHIRSIDKWRWIRLRDFRKQIARSSGFFHATPWDHVELDLTTGKIVEVANPCPTRESLYNLCDEEFVYSLLKEDFVAHREQAVRGFEFDPKVLSRYADALGVKVDFSDPADIPAQVQRLEGEYIFAASRYIVDQAREFTRQNNKKLLVMLSYSSYNVLREIKGNDRFDRSFREYLQEQGITFFNLAVSHAEDRKRYCISD